MNYREWKEANGWGPDGWKTLKVQARDIRERNEAIRRAKYGWAFVAIGAVALAILFLS